MLSGKGDRIGYGEGHARGRLDPTFVYAFTVTERVVTEQNLRNLAKEEVLEWEEAVEEYRRGATKT